MISSDIILLIKYISFSSSE